jgi:hypothetical protein
MSDRSWAGQVARNRVRNEQRKRKVAAERAVIEAARKLKRKQLDNAAGWTAAEYAFVLALEALEEVEK